MKSDQRYTRRQFASDNYAGICPEAWQALAEANQGHVPGYGECAGAGAGAGAGAAATTLLLATQQATDLIRNLFRTDCEVFFVFNGTAANSLALATLCNSYHSVLCHETSHVETDECGAPEFFSNGTKILLASGENGKIEPAAIERLATRRSDISIESQAARVVVVMTQATELGTVYTPQELGAISRHAKKLALRFHMDGARFANAVATLDVEPASITWQAGVDVLSFGATKNGSGAGEAVIFFNRELAAEFDYRCKQAGQLASKMRFLAAPWVGLLRDGAWLRHARQANRMAGILEEGVRRFPPAKILFPRQANSVFVQLPEAIIHHLRELGWRFYTFIGQGGCRLMCSWDTTETDIDKFLEDLGNAFAAG